jgi:hypothetical protein
LASKWARIQQSRLVGGRCGDPRWNDEGHVRVRLAECLKHEAAGLLADQAEGSLIDHPQLADEFKQLLAHAEAGRSFRGVVFKAILDGIEFKKTANVLDRGSRQAVLIRFLQRTSGGGPEKWKTSVVWRLRS